MNARGRPPSQFAGIFVFFWGIGIEWERRLGRRGSFLGVEEYRLGGSISRALVRWRRGRKHSGNQGESHFDRGMARPHKFYVVPFSLSQPLHVFLLLLVLAISGRFKSLLFDRE